MVPDEPFTAADFIASGSVLLVAAHPDDEVIGAGGQLSRLRDFIEILHVTNGSPGNNLDYAEARRRELLEAVALAGISAAQCSQVGVIDQQTSFNLAGIARRIATFLDRFRPHIVLTHPYEGGHPDHDSCAFAVHAAVRRSAAIRRIWEFTSYHIGPNGGIETGVFLKTDEAPETAIKLSAEQQTLKKEMFDCFGTQRHVLADFRLEEERFRPAPQYDFTQPPHPGKLYYEHFEWGVTGSRWRELAAEALHDLGLNLHATHRC